MLKRIIISTVLLAICLPSIADIPVIDPTNIIQVVKEALQEEQEFEKSYDQSVRQYYLEATSSDRSTQNRQNIAANQIVRLTQNSDDLANRQLELDFAPALTACETNSIGQGLRDNDCIVQSLIKKYTTHDTSLSLGGDPQQPYQTNVAQSVMAAVKTQQTLAKKGGATAGIDASTLMSPNIDGYSQQQQAQANYTRQLLLNPIPRQNPVPRKLRNKADLNLVYQHERVNQEVYAARHSVAASVLSSIQAENTKNANGVSEIGMMNKFVRDRFLNPEWVEKITNTHPNKKDKKILPHLDK